MFGMEQYPTVTLPLPPADGRASIEVELMPKSLWFIITGPKGGYAHFILPREALPVLRDFLNSNQVEPEA